MQIGEGKHVSAAQSSRRAGQGCIRGGSRDAGPHNSLCEGVGQAQEGGWQEECPGRVEVVVPLQQGTHCQRIHACPMPRRIVCLYVRAQDGWPSKSLLGGA